MSEYDGEHWTKRMTPAPGEEWVEEIREQWAKHDDRYIWVESQISTLLARLRAVEGERDGLQEIRRADGQAMEQMAAACTHAEQRVTGLEAGLEHARWFVPAKGSVMIGAETQAHLDGFYAALTAPPPAQEEAQ